jgi:hypothetical protein
LFGCPLALRFLLPAFLIEQDQPLCGVRRGTGNVFSNDAILPLSQHALILSL